MGTGLEWLSPTESYYDIPYFQNKSNDMSSYEFQKNWLNYSLDALQKEANTIVSDIREPDVIYLSEIPQYETGTFKEGFIEGLGDVVDIVKKGAQKILDAGQEVAKWVFRDTVSEPQKQATQSPDSKLDVTKIIKDNWVLIAIVFLTLMILFKKKRGKK